MTGVRPLTPAQLAENAEFLEELRRTGNAREAARRLGVHRAKFTKRRAKHPTFAAQWEAALDSADASLAGGHPDIGRRHAAGRLQLRRVPRYGVVCSSARLSFLGGLRAGLEVRLAAESLGYSHAAFYYYRDRNPAFAREWDHARKIGSRWWLNPPRIEQTFTEAERKRVAAAAPYSYVQIDEAREGEPQEVYEVTEAAYARPKKLGPGSPASRGQASRGRRRF